MRERVGGGGGNALSVNVLRALLWLLLVRCSVILCNDFPAIVMLQSRDE